jgi:hypothetical protein
MRAVGREMAHVLSFGEATKPHHRMGYAGEAGNLTVVNPIIHCRCDPILVFESSSES